MCKRITMDEWIQQGESLFGTNKKDWMFRCVKCGEVQSFRDFEKAEVQDPENCFYFSCIGRFVEGRGCNWTLGGLFQIHKVEVLTEEGHVVPVFQFATDAEIEAA